MNFEFATATRIVFGAGTLGTAAPLVREMGRRVLLVGGRNPARSERLQSLLRAANVATVPFAVGHEPTTSDVEQGVAAARAGGCDVVVALGGGSVIDAGKAIAALLTNERPMLDYLEVIGRAQPLERPPAPFVAIPTTAGTGAEVTRNAVLASVEHRVKVSLRSPRMLPKVAVVDPELTYDLPAALTASTGMDALTQLIEPYVSSRANPMTDALCVEGIRRVARALPRACEHGADALAREEMCLGSLFGGLALANAGLGAVHGLAGPIGGAFPAPHGAVCAALLPHVTAMNLRALRQRQPGSLALRRYDEVARLLTGDAHATADTAVTWLATLVERLAIPRLAAYGITLAAVPGLVEAALKASSMKANPVPLTETECREALVGAL